MPFSTAAGNKVDVTRDDSQRRFLAQHSVTTLLRPCFGWLQHCSRVATLCCAKNRRFKSSRVTLPLVLVQSVVLNEARGSGRWEYF